MRAHDPAPWVAEFELAEDVREDGHVEDRHLAGIFAPSCRPQTPVHPRVVLDCSRKPAHAFADRYALARAVRDDFWRGCWKPCGIQPELRYLGASSERTADGFAAVSMHAKCIIIDRKVALVGSANFSNRGRDRNLEVGAIVREHHFVQALVAEWETLWPELEATW